MIISEIKGNIHEEKEAQPHVERVYLRSDELVKRIQRVKTDHGKEIGIKLSKPVDLIDGDILHRTSENVIVISVLEDEVIVIQPDSLKQMGEVAHMLGNRHLPAQFEGNEMIVQHDYLVVRLLTEMNVTHVIEERKMKEAFKYIGHD
ncbi:urease accessory protein UreE [Pseudalkalibacillus hwajinpoensis]|uniref:urease accessory protein UreE n=1 Tax=Guptibacillus hwajinpoensis TaxID=208199 RepID=UPI001CD4EFEC|nr:urease accessory protein UreE [Pseudalkalibacillus hwajinpoensis]MCA0992788.1 urease accessory protein UreE [Pseudalkalibacillus hwajinpoensis]